MEDTLDEVVSKKSFDSLIRAVNTEKEKKASLQHTILKYGGAGCVSLLRC